jgi:hypothetical protein
MNRLPILVLKKQGLIKPIPTVINKTHATG